VNQCWKQDAAIYRPRKLERDPLSSGLAVSCNQLLGDHPFGAYFTTLPPNTTNLAKKLRIPRRKIEFVFCFQGADGLLQIPGGRGDYVWYSPSDYRVKYDKQHEHGRADEGKCK